MAFGRGLRLLRIAGYRDPSDTRSVSVRASFRLFMLEANWSIQIAFPPLRLHSSNHVTQANPAISRVPASRYDFTADLSSVILCAMLVKTVPFTSFTRCNFPLVVPSFLGTDSTQRSWHWALPSLNNLTSPAPRPLSLSTAINSSLVSCPFTRCSTNNSPSVTPYSHRPPSLAT